MNPLNISQFYGKNEKPDYSKLWISAIMTLLSIGLLIALVTVDTNEINGHFMVWAFGYLSIFIFAVALVITSFFYFEKTEGSEKYKFIRKVFLIVALLILAVVCIPLTIALFVLNKLNMGTLFRYSGLYGISLILSFLINATLFVLLFNYLQITFGNYVNAMTISFTVLFILNYFILKLSGTCYFYFSKAFTRRKKKLKQGTISNEVFDTLELRDRQAKAEFMKVIYVMNFAIIAVGSAAIYFINLEQIFPNIYMEQLRSSILYSFALYTAFDRLWDKWKKSLGSDKKE